jgi:hypothetical protein
MSLPGGFLAPEGTLFLACLAAALCCAGWRLHVEDTIFERAPTTLQTSFA